MDCETRSRTLNCIFRAERKKFRFFVCSVILFSIFVETIKQNNYEKFINELLRV